MPKRLIPFLSYWLPVLLWTCFIFSVSLRSDPVKMLPARVSNQVTHSLPKPVTIDEVGHSLEFAVLGGLTLRLARRKGCRWAALGWAALGCGAAAVMDEAIQHFTPGRAFEARDVGLDLAAAGGGILATYLLKWLMAQKRKREFARMETSANIRE